MISSPNGALRLTEPGTVLGADRRTVDEQGQAAAAAAQRAAAERDQFTGLLIRISGTDG